MSYGRHVWLQRVMFLLCSSLVVVFPLLQRWYHCCCFFLQEWRTVGFIVEGGWKQYEIWSSLRFKSVEVDFFLFYEFLSSRTRTEERLLLGCCNGHKMKHKNNRVRWKRVILKKRLQTVTRLGLSIKIVLAYSLHFILSLNRHQTHHDTHAFLHLCPNHFIS